MFSVKNCRAGHTKLERQDLRTSDRLAYWGIWEDSHDERPLFLRQFFEGYVRREGEEFMTWIKRLAFLSDRLQSGLQKGGLYLDLVLHRDSHRLDTLANPPRSQAASETECGRNFLRDHSFNDFCDPQKPDYDRCKLSSHISYDEARSYLHLDESLGINLGNLVQVRTPSVGTSRLNGLQALYEEYNFYTCMPLLCALKVHGHLPDNVKGLTDLAEPSGNFKAYRERYAQRRGLPYPPPHVQQRRQAGGWYHFSW